MFNFRSHLSQLPSLYFLLISFTYVTVIKGAHLSFLAAVEGTGFYTGAFHKTPDKVPVPAPDRPGEYVLYSCGCLARMEIRVKAKSRRQTKSHFLMCLVIIAIADKRSAHTNDSAAQRPNLWLHSKLMSCERA